MQVEVLLRSCVQNVALVEVAGSAGHCAPAGGEKPVMTSRYSMPSISTIESPTELEKWIRSAQPLELMGELGLSPFWHIDPDGTWLGVSHRVHGKDIVRPRN
jgi:hypothetical protein